jgi:hypothetical protein
MGDKYSDKVKWIHQFFDGALKEEDYLFIKNKIETEIDWKEEAEKQATIINGIKYYGISKEVNTIHHKMVTQLAINKESRAKTVSIKKVIRLATAVAASILLIVSGIKGYQFISINPDKVYSEHYVSYQTTVTRGTDNENITYI